MVKGRIFGTILMILGILVFLTPRLFFPVCGLEDNAFKIGGFWGHHGCHGTLRAVTVLSVILFFSGIMTMMRPHKRMILIASVSSIFVAIFLILFPTAITGICIMPTMPCRLGTLPALVFAAIVTSVAGMVGIIIYRQK